MIDDVHEPLEQYAALFKDTHARNTSEFFENLVRESKVDENQNIATVKELRQLEQLVSGASSKKRWSKILRGSVIAISILCMVYIYAEYDWLWMFAPAAFLAVFLYKLNPIIRDTDLHLKNLENQCNGKRAEAWQQMAPLNRLYDWNIAAKLVQKTVPRLEFDPYFANGRLDELRTAFGWSDEFNSGRSITFAHSGVLNGNPFVVAQALDHWMGEKTYEGSKTISWTERVRDSDGKWRTETRSQTLRATISRPFPEYGNQTFIIYGNEAAPNLSFSRRPSSLSSLDDGFFSNWKKNRAIKKLEEKSRKMDEDHNFTVMANQEFDALFGAIDRDHEVQFRLLFTPLAQQEMLKLLKDKAVGYGDDFEFFKHRMVNVVEPRHMRAIDIGKMPSAFHAYELAHARTFFNSYHNEFFRSFYFGIAPLLSIPLYQQHRSHTDIYKDVYSSQSCYWEHESIANYFGERAFQHTDCITRSILKTESKHANDGAQTVRVTAHGYKGEKRVTYVSVHGGDGRHHDVPVHWTEYFQVEQSSSMVLKEIDPISNTESNTAQPYGGDELLQEIFKKRGIDFEHTILRRSVAAARLPM